MRGKYERIESIHFAESSVERQEKKLCYPSLRFGKEDTLICNTLLDSIGPSRSLYAVGFSNSDMRLIGWWMYQVFIFVTVEVKNLRISFSSLCVVVVERGKFSLWLQYCLFTLNIFFLGDRKYCQNGYVWQNFHANSLCDWETNEFLLIHKQNKERKTNNVNNSDFFLSFIFEACYITIN